jgi:hypothetical protein
MYFQTKCGSGRTHREDGGLLLCRYEGHGQWYAVCATCGVEKAACGVCKAKPYPDAEEVLATLPEGWYERVGDSFICIGCGMRYDITALYHSRSHIELDHKVDLSEFQ